MQRNQLLATALGLALVAGPVLAQQYDAPSRRDLPMQNGSTPMPAPARTGPNLTGPGVQDFGAASPDMTAQPRPGMRSQRAAQRAANRQDAGELVQDASDALRRGRVAEANDLLEQSETRLLTRSAPVDRAGQPMRSPVLDRIAAARAALQARDRVGAQREMDLALAGLRTARADIGSGSSDAGAVPLQGGGPGWGGQTMRDGGSAGATISRADAIIRVQSGSTGGGGLSGSTPGSPGVGNQGSTPSTLPGTTTQPRQGSATSGSSSRSGSPGVGAPPPGSATPQGSAGGSGVGSGSGTIRPGSTQSGGGTGSNPGR